MQLLMCSMPTQHRLLASWLPTLSRMGDNKSKINPENPIPPTFENIIHWSKMATSISAKNKVPIQPKNQPQGKSSLIRAQKQPSSNPNW